MARNQPNILIDNVDKVTYKHSQVVEAEGVWAVFYDNQPINIKSSHYLIEDTSPKYLRHAFSNPGHAINLCKKLNKQFKTDKFAVFLLSQGPLVYPMTKTNEPE